MDAQLEGLTRGNQVSCLRSDGPVQVLFSTS